MAAKIEWDKYDQEGITNGLIYSNEWFLKPCHKTVALRCYTALLNTQVNLREVERKLKASESEVVELEKEVNVLSEFKEKYEDLVEKLRPVFVAQNPIKE